MDIGFFPPYLFNCLNSSRIELIESRNNFGVSGESLFSLCIKVNRNDSEEEQIKAILQGVVRFHPEFFSYASGLLEGSWDRNEQFELEIEKYAKRVYISRPDIVKIVKEKLRR